MFPHWSLSVTMAIRRAKAKSFAGLWDALLLKRTSRNSAPSTIYGPIRSMALFTRAADPTANYVALMESAALEPNTILLYALPRATSSPPSARKPTAGPMMILMHIGNVTEMPDP